MHIARYRVKDVLMFDIVKDDRVTDLVGSIFDRPTETGNLRPLAEVELLAPVRPTKIVCVGQNYTGHIRELGAPVPEQPVIFLKPPSNLIGPGREIVYPAGAEQVDYEGELAVIIGQTMSRIPEDEALDYVLGYACFNDVTERDMAAKDLFLLTLAKDFDTFSCLGPWLAADLNPDDLNLRTLVNDRVRQEDSTARCVFSVPRILSFISRFMTLLPGDVVITGTPQGVGPLKPGDEVSVEIAGLGLLTNLVVG